MIAKLISLIRKDFFALWSEKTMGPMLIALLMVSALFAPKLNLTSLLLVLFTASSYIMNVFSLDEKFRTERLIVSLPVRRRDIVLARYCGILAIAAAYLIVAHIANGIAILSGKPGLLPVPLGYCVMVLTVLGLLASFTLPIYFKFGMARAKTVTNLLLAVFMGLVVVVMNFPQNGGANQVMMKILEYLNSPFPTEMLQILSLIGLTILLWGVSIPVAVALYLRREL